MEETKKKTIKLYDDISEMYIYFKDFDETGLPSDG